jgi:hypothetical protein
MSISTATINALPIGKDVYDDLTFCFQEWTSAGSEACLALPDPEDPDSRAYWYISVIGNLAWAATVFFSPPTLVIAGVTKLVVASANVATKATSMMGAGLAAGLVPELAKLGPNLNSTLGKQFLADYLEVQVPGLLNTYADLVKSWVHLELRNHLVAQYTIRFHPDPSEANDAEFINFYNSVDGGRERRRTVWNDFVFPSYETPFDKGQQAGRAGLKHYLLRQLNDAVADHDRQWKAYVKNYLIPYQQKRLNFVLAPVLPPFNPVLHLKGVPPVVQHQQRQNERNLRFMLSCCM